MDELRVKGDVGGDLGKVKLKRKHTYECVKKKTICCWSCCSPFLFEPILTVLKLLFNHVFIFYTFEASFSNTFGCVTALNFRFQTCLHLLLV